LSKKDTLYAGGMPHADFVFDDKVAAVFEDMINRSVPGYATIVSTVGTLSARFAQADSNCYDLGCSLGATTLAMRHAIETVPCRIIAVDNSPAMVDACRKALAADRGTVPVELQCADILDLDLENASVVVMNFTLQFIQPALRDDLIARIHRGLLPGGVLILSEKLRFEDPLLDGLFIELYHRFKEQQGYSKLEISRKRTALEKVLVPETIRVHEARIRKAGFSTFDLWFQCFNFAAMIAVKT